MIVGLKMGDESIDVNKLLEENVNLKQKVSEYEIKIKDNDEKITSMSNDISKLQKIILNNLSFEKKEESSDEPEVEKSFNEMYFDAIKENEKK